MGRRLLREEKTKTTILKVYIDEDGNETAEYYAPVKGEMKRCSKLWWGGFKVWEKTQTNEILNMSAEDIYRKFIGKDYTIA